MFFTEYCTKDREGRSTKKVEFSFELTSEAFKQKLVEIYPKLEDACFVFMKGEGIKLVELSPGECCFWCYTPENVFYSERGQGRLYIKKIEESEVRVHCILMILFMLELEFLFKSTHTLKLDV